MTELVRSESPANDLEAQMKYSSALSASSIIPRDYQNSPANVLVAIGYAQALGEHPIAALTDVYIVKGRPSMSATMMHRRAIEAGHRVRVTASPTEAKASVWRKDDPDYEHTVTWTLERAKSSGVAGTDTWKKFPSAMLRSRAISEVCRLACPEVLGAVKYTPDEIGGAFADTPDQAPADPPQATTRVSRRKPDPEPVDAEIAPPSQDAEEVREELAASTGGQANLRAAIAGDLITDAQMKKLCATFQERGIPVDDYPGISKAIGREVTSKKQITRDEATRLIDQLSN